MSGINEFGSGLANTFQVATSDPGIYLFGAAAALWFVAGTVISNNRPDFKAGINFAAQATFIAGFVGALLTTFDIDTSITLAENLGKVSGYGIISGSGYLLHRSLR